MGGRRVSKDSQRIEAYGTVDELNAMVGLTRARNRAHMGQQAAGARLDKILKMVQQDLFDLGSALATPPEVMVAGMPEVGEVQVKSLEQIMDGCQKELTPLASFVLPGGGEISSLLHLCRTVCRRAEREVLRLSRQEEMGPWPVAYLNRLSDLFFVLSRWVGKHLGEREELWERGLQRRPRSRHTASRKEQV